MYVTGHHPYSLESHLEILVRLRREGRAPLSSGSNLSVIHNEVEQLDFAVGVLEAGGALRSTLNGSYKLHWSDVKESLQGVLTSLEGHGECDREADRRLRLSLSLIRAARHETVRASSYLELWGRLGASVGACRLRLVGRGLDLEGLLAEELSELQAAASAMAEAGEELANEPVAEALAEIQGAPDSQPQTYPQEKQGTDRSDAILKLHIHLQGELWAGGCREPVLVVDQAGLTLLRRPLERLPRSEHACLWVTVQL